MVIRMEKIKAVYNIRIVPYLNFQIKDNNFQNKEYKIHL